MTATKLIVVTFLILVFTLVGATCRRDGFFGPRVVISGYSSIIINGRITEYHWYAVGVRYRGIYKCVTTISENPLDYNFNSNAFAAAREMKARLERELVMGDSTPMKAIALRVPEMAQKIRDTFEDVQSVEEVPGNPNICGYYLFRVTDSQNRSGRVWVTPEGEVVTPEGK